jgi:predicted Rossmann fold flavoprotein
VKHHLIVVGGGAAGFFCAIQCAERNPDYKILILEKSNKLLSKVKISGGGRCNVTHACYEPIEMVKNYPRGNKELLGPFHQFLCGDMMQWLEENGVQTKTEADGRVFPVTDNSQTIIDCFMNKCKQLDIEIKTCIGINAIEKTEKGWLLHTSGNTFLSDKIMLATGSSTSAWKMAESLGHTIIPPVPSLFTFNINNHVIDGLAGVSVPDAVVTVCNTEYLENGPLLITHWGLSGPAVLKLSARAARELHKKNYSFDVTVNWINQTEESVSVAIENMKKNYGKNKISISPLFGIPKRLWQRMSTSCCPENLNFADLNNSQKTALINQICNCVFKVNGKSTFKEEFVTCGGIDTREVNFKTMESRIHKGLYFAGEVLNIDAVTGGFNFQAAWTTAYIAAKSMGNE